MNKTLSAGCLCLFALILSVHSATAQTPGSKQITVDENLWLRLVDEPSHHMNEARQRFLSNDRRGAGQSLRTAAVFLRISSQNSPKATRNGLLASATELESEALRVQAGSRNSVTALDQTFARAEYALARHHHAAATESWGKKQTRVVGYRMQAAANSAERATVWTGQKVGEGAKGAYQGARTLSGGLIEGSGFVVDQVGKGLGAVGDHIFQLGKKVSPQPVSPQSLKRLTEPRRDFPDCPLGYRGAGADRPVRIDPPRRAFFLP